MKVFISVLLVLMAILSLYAQVDESAMLIYEQSFERAVYSFALVKGLNALISVIQSTEINVSLFVGATVGIGQVLDPINDLVERFSVVMLVSSVSIGIQHLLLLLGKSLFVKVILFASIIVSLLGVWIKKINTSHMFVFSVKLMFLLLVLRFGAVVFIYSTQFIYQDVYAQEYEQSNAYIQSYKNDLETIRENKKDIDTLLERLKYKTQTFTKKVINLITIFIVTTILFPLLFLWLFVLLIKIIFNSKTDYDIISQLKYKGTE
ncbi:MAG: hypothetical protein ACI9TV_000976 [Sulfurimonas sp.]|jgi:hypothetical protein|uniref:hypothetical protein n=1 Tax=Sulfurimonas sp. TaxID=2022749 RepID=UPI0039E4F812